MEKGKMNTRMNKEKTNQDPTNKDTERPFQRAHTRTGIEGSNQHPLSSKKERKKQFMPAKRQTLTRSFGVKTS
jgi:hypothetical protein